MIAVALLSLFGTSPAPLNLSFSSPADEANLTSVVPVRASAGQPEAVKSLTFYLDGVELRKASGPAAAFQWDTTKVSDGWHTLSAVAEDGSRKSEARLAVMVHNFKDTSAPKLSVTWPRDGNPKSGWLTTRVQVSDNIKVTTVETYIDGKCVANSSAAPYDMKWSWKRLAKGEHVLFCKAYDAAGNVTRSADIKLTK